MIPKIIHYCWYGKKKMPRVVRKCIKSWKKFCPEYEIVCWNEENTNFHYNSYLWEAYQKKRWAFVSDVVRLMAVYEYGGIYLDTDVELLKPIDSLLINQAYFAKETLERVATGLGFGAEKHNWVVNLLLQDYKESHFIMENGQLDQTSCPKRLTKVLREIGLEEGSDIQNLNGCMIYPPEYFCPRQFGSKVIKITDNTYSIHYFRGSWIPFEYKVKKAIVILFGKLGYKMIKLYDKILYRDRI